MNHTDELLHDIAREVAVILLPEKVRRAIEADVPEARPGDIDSGRLVLLRIRYLATRVELGMLIPGEDSLRNHTVELLGLEDVGEIVAAFRLLASWDCEEVT